MDRDSLTRPLVARLCVLALIVVLLVPSGVSALTHEPIELQRGTIDEPANGTTVIAVQGFKGRGQNSSKKPARLVGVGPEGDLKWHYEPKDDVTWFYDVDPLDDGTLLVTGVTRDGTTVFKYDPATNSRVWTERLDAHDTHDVDLINGDELLVANMRNYNETTGVNDDRLYVYNRTTESVVWEYRFERIYDRGDGGDYTGDWTHVNDVDKIGEGRYLASPRNMDEVVVINRSTKDVELSLGSPDDHSVMYEQHNPQYLESESGVPTILVADSENDRVVEYELRNGSGRNATWERTWNLGADGNLNWPRDADRLRRATRSSPTRSTTASWRSPPRARSSGSTTPPGAPTRPSGSSSATNPAAPRSPTRTPRAPTA
ncbi:aryl-sulfate sulfotransferase [Halosimplex aquaticum]